MKIETPTQKIIDKIKNSEELTRQEICNMDCGAYGFDVVSEKYLGFWANSDNLCEVEHIIRVDDKYWAYSTYENINETVYVGQTLVEMKLQLMEVFVYA